MLEILGMRTTSLLALLPGSEWVAPDRVKCIGQIELFDIKTGCKHMTYAKLNC